MNGQIPRGLLTRDGTAVKPNSRLPSLMGDRTTTTPTKSSSPSSGGVQNGLLSSTPPLAIPPSTSISSVSTQARLLASITTIKNRTRGGAQKRVFKPNVAAAAAAAKTSSSTNASNEYNSPRKHSQSHKHEARETAKPYIKHEKKYLQSDSSVFSGITVTKEVKSRGGYSSGSYGSTSSIRIKDEVKKKVDDDRVDYIIDSSDEEGSPKIPALEPFGFDFLYSVAKKRNKSKHEEEESMEVDDTHDSTIASLLEQEGKVIFFQLSDQLIPQMSSLGDLNDSSQDVNRLTLDALAEKNGYLGTIRVYESGRIDFTTSEGIEPPSKTVRKSSQQSSSYSQSNNFDAQLFSVIKAEENVSQKKNEEPSILVKNEDGSRRPVAKNLTNLNPNMSLQCLRNREEVVLLNFTEGEAVSLGEISASEKLIVIPQVLTSLDDS